LTLKNIIPICLCLFLFPQLSAAGCSWEFDWYCSDCAKIGGRTTGTESGYPSEAACDSARNSTSSHVTTMSCERVGMCDEPRKPNPPSSQSTPPNRGYSNQPSTSYAPNHEAMRRQNEENRRQEQERIEAEQAKQKRKQQAFEESKRGVLNQLKGTTFDGRSSPSSSSDLKLKTGTPAFGIKTNPSGTLQLKKPAAVSSKPDRKVVVDPAFFTKPKQRLRIRHVPNPMQAPMGTWLRYVKSDRAGLILDALQDGKGDLDKAIDYLDGQIIRHGSHKAASSALSYLEGLRTSYIAAGAEHRKLSSKQGQQVTVESKALLQAIMAASGVRKWPGPTNPNPGDKPLNLDDWRVKRANKLLTALKAAPGDLEKSYRMLRSDRETIVAADAEYYLRGAFAYWDFLADQGGKK